MKSQQVSRVDLSLDDIIKMDGLGQPQEQSKGGNNRGQGNQRGKGQGQRGFRMSGQQGGGGPGFSGVSPLNRGKEVSGGSTMNNRPQTTGGGGQRNNGRAWTMKRGGQWGGSAFSGGTNRTLTRQMNNRNYNSNRPQHTSAQGGTQGGNQLYNRGRAGPQLNRRGKMSTVTGPRQGQGGIASNFRHAGIGHDQSQGQGGGGGIGQDTLRITVAQTSLQNVRGQRPVDQSSLSNVRGQRPSHQGVKQITFDEKRRMAMQALREARKTIAQLDQQAARQQVVNSRRGITSQPSGQGPGQLYQSQGDGRYTSSLPLALDSSPSSSSDSELPGRQITSFNLPSASACLPGHKRWQQKSSERDHFDSTLTISIDNSAPFVSHSDFPPAPGSPRCPSPHRSHSAPHHGRQLWSQASPDRRRQHSQQPSSRHSDDHHQQYQHPSLANRRHSDSRPSHFLAPPQEDGAERDIEGLDMRRGATQGFSRQLAQLKPTVSMKYMFQKKSFSSASTPVSLNDRFSDPASDDPADRKVFM
ncbi:uncharacterized protein LOC143289251 [Babylonia areolata]|uniref:uncharacterized protein LOC143289251 n=1 Tax=Babylonia areolata TaxID=304850 RepID=UPI003FD2AF1B